MKSGVWSSLFRKPFQMVFTPISYISAFILVNHVAFIFSMCSQLPSYSVVELGNILEKLQVTGMS